LAHARTNAERPSMIVLRSHIGYGAPHLQDSPKAHGSPLGEDEVRATKAGYGWPEDAQFLVPEGVLAHTRQAVERGKRWEDEWQEAFSRYREAHPDLAARFETAQTGALPANWDADLKPFDAGSDPVATRAVGHKVLARLGARIPWLMGGAADLASSTKTVIEDGGDFEKGHHEGRNLHWGIREHVMCAASSGMALHGGLRPFASTFFIFTDYARPAIRLAALMELPVIYVMTHDSIGLGQDGPTHQPIEQLASFRAMPNMCVIRPADANETVHAWRAALTRRDGPTMLVLTRQKLPVLDHTEPGAAQGVAQGAYVLSPERGERPDVILLATGSEVHLTLAAQDRLSQAHGIDARVVSMPSWELFREQSDDYKDSVLPSEVTARLAVEAASPQGWCEWVGSGGRVLGITRFGASAPAGELFRHFGFTVENIIEHARAMLGR
ncbi:MAG: transketolase C-terminal domain-containing protein, partial [Gammaproteobacteria bacterium]